MEDFVGQTFSGIVSSVTSFGMFVELPDTIEGFVTVVEMHDDYYIYDEKMKTLIGERRGKVFRIGDEIEVLLIKADKETRRIDFACG